MKFLGFLSLLILGAQCRSTEDQFASLKFAVSFTKELSAQAQNGRLLLMLAAKNKSEPRFQINDGLEAQLVFGIDIEGLNPGQEIILNSSNLYGFPIQSIRNIPAGEYFVQVLINRYETFHLITGHTVALPPDHGEGQQWNQKPGNFYSKPIRLRIDPKQNKTIALVIDQKIAPLEVPKDTKYVKHIKIQSRLLTAFWGRPMFIGANVLLPEGFDTHPRAHYPLMIYHGHFPSDFGGFRTNPPDPHMDTTDYIERFGIYGYTKIQQQEAYNFYQKWTSKKFPRFLIIEVQHANPYYDDSYAVNSANLGPYGDAIMRELVPEIEKKFRGLGQGWARFTYGGSTGGWEALAVQLFYPDDFNGCFAACPDPIDFRSYALVDIYKDTNAYWYSSKFKRLPRPAHRNYLGQIQNTMDETNHYELALGTHSRSGQQWDIWEAVFSPQDADGYPKRIFDKLTGRIDPAVASYWKEHYDLRYILERDWKTLGPKLEGKIHIYCGDMDNYYLNDAVYRMEDFLKRTKNPFYKGEVDYGDRAEHCWNGDHNNPNYISRLRYNTFYLPSILKRISASAPRDLTLRVGIINSGLLMDDADNNNSSFPVSETPGENRNEKTRTVRILGVRLWQKIRKIFFLLFLAQLIYLFLLKWIDPPVTITQASSWLIGDGLKRDYINQKEMSPNIRLAVMASEDQLFPDHSGFDWKSIEQAISSNKSKPRRIRGASTISQQVAKNVFLWQGRSWVRKGLEAYFTFMIELFWSKERILEMYLNVAEMGKGVFGVEAASRQYFRKPCKKLTPVEAAMIAASLPNPKKFTVKPLSLYVSKRYPWVLQQMGFLAGDPDIQQLLK